MNQKSLIKEIKAFLQIKIYREVVDYTTIEIHKEDHFERQLIKYKGNENDEINAYLFIPTKRPV